MTKFSIIEFEKDKYLISGILNKEQLKALYDELIEPHGVGSIRNLLKNLLVLIKILNKYFSKLLPPSVATANLL